MKRRAFLSVSDKTGLIPFAEGLVECGFELVSTGGTEKALKQAGVPVTNVSEITGFPRVSGRPGQDPAPDASTPAFWPCGTIRRSHGAAGTRWASVPIDVVCRQPVSLQADHCSSPGVTLEECH